ncbi:hypothetical protein ABVC73_02185 [Prevotella melaninogenica]
MPTSLMVLWNTLLKRAKNHKPRTIRVPLNDKAKAILAKYADLETRLLPKINQNIYNRQIKKILKLLGIDRMVMILTTKLVSLDRNLSAILRQATLQERRSSATYTRR